MTVNCASRFDDTIVLASDTFAKNPRQKKIKFGFLRRIFLKSDAVARRASWPRKQFLRATIQKSKRGVRRAVAPCPAADGTARATMCSFQLLYDIMPHLKDRQQRHAQQHRHFGPLSRIHRRLDRGSRGKFRWSGTSRATCKGPGFRQKTPQIFRTRIFSGG